MNSRERMKSTIAFKPVDRPFRWETPGIWGETVNRWEDEGMPAHAREDLSAFLGYDRLQWLPLGTWTAEPFLPRFEYRLLEDEGEKIVISDTDGIVKRIRKWKSELSMPQFLEFPVRTREDYDEKILPRFDYTHEGHFDENWYDLAKDCKDRDFTVGMFVIGPFGHLRNLMGDEQLMYAMFDDPELIHYIMERWKIYYAGLLNRVLRDIEPDFIMIWEDMCFKNGPLCSPAQYREYMFNPLTEVIDSAKSLGIQGIFVDNDGDCTLMIPLYLEAGANGFYPFECQAGMDIREVRKRYGKSFVIIGGIEKYTLSDDRSEEEMRREVFDKVVPMLELGGYIPMLDHSAPPNISYERFMSFLDYVRGLPEQ